ncbi:hypothetical protein [Mycobacterium sp. DL592]|uniref:hypothetical protein n=1 Tax=Mycobacterium sp. DL592 TaxID=2675524 RepID=UPI00141DE329|nr:hypothetical protein [Mycobacterium sp. DL592]
MWIALYLAVAIVAAAVTWHASHRFQSLDAPSEAVRAAAALVAGALWPVVVVGVLQLQALRYVARRLRTRRVQAAEPTIPAQNRS